LLKELEGTSLYEVGEFFLALLKTLLEVLKVIIYFGSNVFALGDHG